MKGQILLAAISLIVYANCTYQRPLLSVRVSTVRSENPITHRTTVQSNYQYWGIKKIMYRGGYSKMVQSDSSGNVILIRHWRKKPLNIQDGNVRYNTKIYYYMPTGEIAKITKRIFQNQGVGGHVVRDDVIYFENGKKNKSLNNENQE